MKKIHILACVAMLSFAGVACSSKSTPSGTPSSSPPAADQASVNMTDALKFAPPLLTVKVGVAVVWRNTGSATHTVTSDSGTELASSNISGGGSFSHPFTKAGTYPYHCNIHGKAMSGTITVTA